MNGESVFGWLKVAIVAIAAFAIIYALRNIKNYFTIGAGYNNPVKRGVDSVVSTVTGRDETLGGWLNEMLDPNARKVADMLKPSATTVKPTSASGDEGTRQMLDIFSYGP